MKEPINIAQQFRPTVLVAALLLLLPVDRAQADGITITPSPTSPTTSTTLVTPLIKKIQVAQVHVLPSAQGKKWTEKDGTVLNYKPIAGRAALLLLELDLKGATNPRLEVVVINQRNTQMLPLLRGAANTVVEDNMAVFPLTAQTWSAQIPAAWMQKGVRVRVVANQAEPSRWSYLTLGAPIDFSIKTLPFYLFGANEQTLPFDTAKTPTVAAQQELWAKWPVKTLNIQNHAARIVNWPNIVISPRNNDAAYVVNLPEQKKDGFAIMSAVLSVLSRIRDANGDGGTNNPYYAPLIQADAAGKFVSTGGGLGGGHNGTGDHLYKGIFIHEQGHAFGLPHAGESYRAGSGFPYIGGSLNGSLWGFDGNQNMFLPTIVPTTASSYKNCATQVFDGTPRQMTAAGQCIKQDIMQSGSGDQASGFLYSMLSDYNVAKIQRYFEGLTTVDANGVKKYSGGRIFEDKRFATGYSRWDSISQAWVAFDPKADRNKGLYGAQQNFPISKNVPVYTVVLTVSKAGTANATQIYPLIGPYQGNLLKNFDPSVAQDRSDMTPNTSIYPWYCRNSGCDYTLKVSYQDGSVRHVALHGGFRSWFRETQPFRADVMDASKGDSFETWAVNVPATQAISRVELLDTPMVWNGLPSQPTVLATR